MRRRLFAITTSIAVVALFTPVAVADRSGWLGLT